MTIWLSRLQTIRLKLRFFGGKNLLEILYAMKLQKGEKQNKKRNRRKLTGSLATKKNVFNRILSLSTTLFVSVTRTRTQAFRTVRMAHVQLSSVVYRSSYDSLTKLLQLQRTETRAD